MQTFTGSHQQQQHQVKAATISGCQLMTQALIAVNRTPHDSQSAQFISYQICLCLPACTCEASITASDLSVLVTHLASIRSALQTYLDYCPLL